MKKKVLLFLSLLIVVIGGIYASTFIFPMKTYADKQIDFSFKAPSDFTVMLPNNLPQKKDNVTRYDSQEVAIITDMQLDSDHFFPLEENVLYNSGPAIGGPTPIFKGFFVRIDKINNYTPPLNLKKVSNYIRGAETYVSTDVVGDSFDKNKIVYLEFVHDDKAYSLWGVYYNKPQYDLLFKQIIDSIIFNEN